ncbi:MAG TPA: kelch repeat-containing protein [Archangium sp.]|nr:kelch repeat-containing protein [Archangium sp.]
MTKTLRLSLLMVGFASLAVGCQPGEQPQEPATALASHEAALSGTWLSGAPMSIPRERNSVTLLSSGEVLVSGGAGFSSVLGSAEVYNPYSNTWSPTGALNTPRYHHRATPLASGKVLVTGGMNDYRAPFLTSAEVYDPATGTWRFTSNSMGARRAEHTATRLPSGKVLVAGGASAYYLGTSHNSAELYDPETDTWSATGRMNHSRQHHTATLLSSGKVMVVGGIGATNTAELYDPATGTWSLVATPLQSHSGRHAVAELYSGLVLVAGDGVAELYNPSTNTWTEAPPCPVDEGDILNATRLYSGRVLVTGMGTQSAALYDPVTNTWLPTAQLPQPFASHEAVMLHSGEVLIAGGQTWTGGPTPAVVRFNP